MGASNTQRGTLDKLSYNATCSNLLLLIILQRRRRTRSRQRGKGLVQERYSLRKEESNMHTMMTIEFPQDYRLYTGRCAYPRCCGRAAHRPPAVYTILVDETWYRTRERRLRQLLHTRSLVGRTVANEADTTATGKKVTKKNTRRSSNRFWPSTSLFCRLDV